MSAMMESPPYSPVETVTDILHGKSVSDAYRWLEDQESPRTRDWLADQARYARFYLDSIPGRERIRARIHDLIDVESYDSLQTSAGRYFFRKRLPGQEQACICLREGLHGEDKVLIDPAQRGTGPHTAVKPVCISPDGRLLLYEVKQGGERTGKFELLDIRERETLPDGLPRGHLRGFAFAPDSKAFYYAHAAVDNDRPYFHAAYKHILGANSTADEEVFVAGEDKYLQLYIVPGVEQLGLLVTRFAEETLVDFYLWPFGRNDPEPVIRNFTHKFVPILLRSCRILAITDYNAPNSRIVEVCCRRGSDAEFIDLVKEEDAPIQSWVICGQRIVVSYVRGSQTEIELFNLSGRRLGRLPITMSDTVRLLAASEDSDELWFEQESFVKPIQIRSYHPGAATTSLWAERKVPFDSKQFSHVQVRFPAKDGSQIPMFLVGRPEVLEGGPHPTLMTSYGGYGVPMTPQFSVFVAFLLERGCLFALPNIRGGSECGVNWHQAAKRRNRQVAFDDFIAAATWLIEKRRTGSEKLAIFGGSNCGLLVGAAITQSPALFRAVLCMVPILDMVRYHLFDNAYAWREEFGNADDPDDFAALLRYSPYHNVRDGTAYPATMIVSGDADQSCNPLHARKMTARLQGANVSAHPIILDYSRHRGHAPVLPLRERVEALTDRIAFLCAQLQLPV